MNLANFLLLVMFCLFSKVQSLNVFNENDLNKLKHQLPAEFHHCIEATHIRRDGICGRIWPKRSVFFYKKGVMSKGLKVSFSSTNNFFSFSSKELDLIENSNAPAIRFESRFVLDVVLKPTCPPYKKRDGRGICRLLAKE